MTLHHPHGQIYAYPFVHAAHPAHAGARPAGTPSATGGRNLFADVLAAERAAGDRVVAANEHWTAFVPAAARWPFEVHVAPHRQVPDIPALDDAERDAFGPLYLEVLRRFDGLFDLPMPYISAWHQAPVRRRPRAGHLHLQLFSIRRAHGQAEVSGRLGVRRWASSSTTSPRSSAAERLRAGEPHAAHAERAADRRMRARHGGAETGRGGPGTGPPAGKGRLAVRDSREGWLIGAGAAGDRGQPSWTRLASRPPWSTSARRSPVTPNESTSAYAE